MSRARLFATLLHFSLLSALPPSLAQPSTSPRAPAPLDAELLRDAPLYPPLRDHSPDEPLATPGVLGEVVTDDVTDAEVGERSKRSSQQWDSAGKTGDTILNIRGAVRDAIGDAGAAPGGARASSRLDTFVIRPAVPRPPSHPPLPLVQPSTSQLPKNERELLVEAHSHARIACDLDLRNVSHVRWYKDNEEIVAPPSPGGGAALWAERSAGGQALVLPRAARADAAAWRCAGTSAGRAVSGKPTRLLIYEPVRSVYLAVDGRRLDAGNTWVPVRDKTLLEVRCVAEGGVPQPDLSWKLLALEPALDHRPYLRIHPTNYSIEGVSWSHAVVTGARELHNATLRCEARQRRPAPAAAPATAAPALEEPAAAKLEIHVTYPPSFVISRWPGFGVSLAAGGAAALRCDVDANPPARAWWLRDDQHASSSPPPLEAGAEARGAATLRWAALSATHAGWYRCRASWLHAEYSSIGYYLNVLAPDEESPAPAAAAAPDEEPPHQRLDVPLGGNVQMHCPKGSVGCWWRRALGAAGNASAGGWAPAGSAHAHGVLGIKDALYQEGGEYRCVGARAPDLARLRDLKRVTLHVTGGATAAALSAEPARGGWRLECGACGRALRVLWVRAGGAGGAGGAQPASLTPDLAQHCWRAVLHVTEPDEVWCVAASPAGGAVAVFPARAPYAPPSPAPARRALHNAAAAVPLTRLLSLILAALLLH